MLNIINIDELLVEFPDVETMAWKLSGNQRKPKVITHSYTYHNLVSI